MESNSEILIYQCEDGQTKLDVKLVDETLWLTQKEMAVLFNVTKQNISLHIQNIYDESELDRGTTVKDFLTVHQEGFKEIKRNLEHYNLDMIISVGYRVKSTIATKFRQWATYGNTAAEIIYKRPNSEKLNMGMTSYNGVKPTKAEASIANNYLDENELNCKCS